MPRSTLYQVSSDTDLPDQIVLKRDGRRGIESAHSDHAPDGDSAKPSVTPEDTGKSTAATTDKKAGETAGSDAKSQAESPTRSNRRDTPHSTDQPPPMKPFYRRPVLMICLIAIAIALVVGGGAYWLHARQFEETDDAFIEGHVVQMSPTRVSGYVEKLHVHDNQLVRAGDVLLEIDPRSYQLAVDQALAGEATALEKFRQTEAQLASAEAQAKAAQADVAAADATAENATSELERYVNLAPQGAVSKQALDTSRATANSSSAQVRAAEQRAAAAKSQVHLAQSEQKTLAAQLEEARVEVRQAKLNLGYCKIVAPTTGRVTNRSVDQGNYVQPGQALFALVDPNVWVTANFKETQLQLMRQGQSVEIRVDAYSKQRLRGHIDSFQRGSGARFSILPAENATGNYVKVVQRVPVKIVFDDSLPDEMTLGPGMSVVPTVRVRGDNEHH